MSAKQPDSVCIRTESGLLPLAEGVLRERGACLRAEEAKQPLLPFLGPLIMRGFDSKEKIGRVRAPLLFMQGDRDEVIPYKLGRDLFAAAPEPKSFWTVEGAGHNDLLEVAGDQYREHLAAFYASLL
jgi:hypothetical protein